MLNSHATVFSADQDFFVFKKGILIYNFLIFFAGGGGGGGRWWGGTKIQLRDRLSNHDAMVRWIVPYGCSTTELHFASYQY